jgi:hypothetical protein
VGGEGSAAAAAARRRVDDERRRRRRDGDGDGDGEEGDEQFGEILRPLLGPRQPLDGGARAATIQADAVTQLLGAPYGYRLLTETDRRVGERVNLRITKTESAYVNP